MDSLSTFSSLVDVLHALSQALLVPDILLLLLFAGYALFCIGSILMEYFTERRNFKVAMPKFLADLMAADEADIPEVIRASGLLNRQKSALLTVYDYRTLPGDALLALIRREVNNEETRYAHITGRNNTAAKISPMLGLMGTLIPLGPGVAALGQADPTVLSSSLLIAFDTTVAGLAVAAVCMAVGKIRSNWYNDYLSALDSAMATMLQKIEDLRAEGKLEATEPTNYAFMFEQGLKKGAAAPVQEDKSAPEEAAGPEPATAPEGTPAVVDASVAGSAPGAGSWGLGSAATVAGVPAHGFGATETVETDVHAAARSVEAVAPLGQEPADDAITQRRPLSEDGEV
ncbi:MAG: MotA/TolQ/ExbB proton channel family protein [Eggerthellaceae bacterium]|nr:MotA/TolQ/ExbB proton channel family protein [Eggerthellaceae bacterium]